MGIVHRMQRAFEKKDRLHKFHNSKGYLIKELRLAKTRYFANIKRNKLHAKLF